MKKAWFAFVLILAGASMAAGQAQSQAAKGYGEWGWGNPFVTGGGYVSSGSGSSLGSSALGSGSGISLRGTLSGLPLGAPQVQEHPPVVPGTRSQPPHAPPPFVVVVACLADEEESRTGDVPCMVTVMQYLLSLHKPMQEVKPELRRAIAYLSPGPAQDNLQDAQKDLENAMSLLGAAKFEEAAAKLDGIYQRIKDAPVVSNTAKAEVRGYASFAKGGASLKDDKLADAENHFREAASNISNDQDKAQVLAQQGMTELKERKVEHALADLRQALPLSTNGNLKSVILQAMGRALISINGYNQDEAYTVLQQAISVATSADVKAQAIVQYASAVFHIDEAKAKQSLAEADDACRPSGGCTNSTLDSIQYYRGKWSA